MSFRFLTRTKCSVGLRLFRWHALLRNSSTDILSRTKTVAVTLSGKDTFTVFSDSSREFICNKLRQTHLMIVCRKIIILHLWPQTIDCYGTTESYFFSMKFLFRSRQSVIAIFSIFGGWQVVCAYKVKWLISSSVSHVGAGAEEIDRFSGRVYCLQPIGKYWASVMTCISASISGLPWENAAADAVIRSEKAMCNVADCGISA